MVVVAIIRMRMPKTEEEKGLSAIVVSRCLAGPNIEREAGLDSCAAQCMRRRTCSVDSGLRVRMRHLISAGRDVTGRVNQRRLLQRQEHGQPWARRRTEREKTLQDTGDRTDNRNRSPRIIFYGL